MLVVLCDVKFDAYGKDTYYRFVKDTRYNSRKLLMLSALTLLQEFFMKNGLSILVASALMCSMAFASPTLTSVEQVGITSSEIQIMSERLNQNDSTVFFGTDKIETIVLLSPRHCH